MKFIDTYNKPENRSIFEFLYLTPKEKTDSKTDDFITFKDLTDDHIFTVSKGLFNRCLESGIIKVY